jgi:hypothetical protein
MCMSVTGATIPSSQASTDLNLGQGAEWYVMEQLSLVTQGPLEMPGIPVPRACSEQLGHLHSSFHSSKVPHPLVGIAALGASLR